MKVGLRPQLAVRVPPQSSEAEMALLGGIMLRQDALYEIIDVIKAESFYAERHRMIWSAFLTLMSKSAPIDLLSVCSCLEGAAQLETVGGATYLTTLVNSVPSAANIRYYAELVHKKFVMRELIRAADEICTLGYEESHDVEMALDIAQKNLFEIANKGSQSIARPIKDSLRDALERFDHLHKTPGAMRGVPTGFKELDSKLSGLQNSDLIILAARPSMGKTSLALDIARHAVVNQNIATVIFSLEMSAQQLTDRMVAAESRVDAWKLRTGQLSKEEDFDKIRDAVDTLSRAPLFIDDQPAANILRMRSTARRIKTEHNLGLIIVDYLQLMNPTASRNTDSVVQQVTEISRSLKQLAREMNVPVLALSQLSRAVEQRGGKPRLSDLRDSGSIEQDADVVMFIHREDKLKEDSNKKNIAEIMIEKHRNGPTGHIELYFDDQKSSFLSIDRSFGSSVSAQPDF
jgi:replicative DNA helicase